MTIIGERVATGIPFKTTSFDCAGPLYIATEDSKDEKKMYIMLFTWAPIQAVHLELVGNMSTTSCINAMRKFITRRGVPRVIISHKAKTSESVALQLRKLERAAW